MNSSRVSPWSANGVIESIPQIVWVAAEDGSVEYLNRRGLEYTGMSPEELCGWGWINVIDPGDLLRVADDWKQVLEGSNVAEYRIRRYDGTYHWHEASAAAVRDSNGRVQKWVGTWINIEERKSAERQMRELAAILEQSEDAIIGKTLSGIVTTWNQGAERLFGYSAEEMIGQPIARLIPQEYLEEESQILARLRQGERLDHYETVRRRSDGGLVNVSLSVSPMRDASGKLVGASKIARDITARKKAEQGLRESRARFEGVIESAMDAIITIDETQRVVLFNGAAERMFGCSAAAALGHALDRFIPARFRGAHRAHVQMFDATGVTTRAMGRLGDLVGLRADGREFPIEASISQSEVDGTKLFTVMLRDITVRKETEERLIHSEIQLRALAARMQRAREEEGMRIARELHDQLGRCLTSIKMDLLWIEKTLSRHPTHEEIHSINEKTQMMLEAIDETVTVVRRISTELRPGILDDLGLGAAVEWQANDFQKRSGISCILNITEEELELNRDQATAFFRIFQELLTNAARHSRASKLWVHLEARDGIVTLEVEDDGVGIPPDAASRPHALGLAGMRERAAIFGGHVEFSGIQGKGTTVIVRMPIDENPGR